MPHGKCCQFVRPIPHNAPDAWRPFRASIAMQTFPQQNRPARKTNKTLTSYKLDDRQRTKYKCTELYQKGMTPIRYKSPNSLQILQISYKEKHE
jgi:hypothetical protein